MKITKNSLIILLAVVMLFSAFLWTASSKDDPVTEPTAVVAAAGDDALLTETETETEVEPGNPSTTVPTTLPAPESNSILVTIRSFFKRIINGIYKFFAAPTVDGELTNYPLEIAKAIGGFFIFLGSVAWEPVRRFLAYFFGYEEVQK